MSTAYILPIEFNFYLLQDGSFLGQIRCEYQSAQFTQLVSACYSWECPWYSSRRQLLSWNWLRELATFTALLSPPRCA